MNRVKEIFCKSGGFTLIEIMIVMAVFIVVVVISSNTFTTILHHSGLIFKSEESNIEGIVGLEMFRHDLQQAGYGLYTEQGPNYNEAADTLPATNNDAPNNAPRPLVFLDNMDGIQSVNSYVPLAGSDYLSIKGTTASTATTAQKWTFMNISSTHVLPNTWASAADNFAPTDNVIVLQKQFGNPPRTSLIPSQTGSFFSAYNSGFANMSSAMNGIYMVYGINSAATANPRFPFNRTDYFIASPAVAANLPTFCAQGTGILYKSTVNQSDGKLNIMPLLDCVLDMQVVLGWDTDGDGLIDTWTNADGTNFLPDPTNVSALTGPQNISLSSAQNNSLTTVPNIRNNLKMIKVYIVVQDGRKDTSFTSASPLKLYDELSLTRPNGSIVLTPAQRNYRWKLYRIIVRPKNLLANQ